MLLRLSLIVCIPSSKTAFEPWASKTEPSDVPKQHVQEVTSSPFTYTIHHGGTVDGKMCSSLPGVWEPYEQSWEGNRSIRMENIGSANVINPWLRIGPIDFFPNKRSPIPWSQGFRPNGKRPWRFLRDAAKPNPGAKFWKIEPLKFSLIQKPAWMNIDPAAGLITGISDGSSGPVVVSVTLTKERRLVHDKNAIVWGNEYEQSKTYETVGPAIQQFVLKP